MLPTGDFPMDDEAMIEAILNDPDHPDYLVFSMLDEVGKIRAENGGNNMPLEVFQDVFYVRMNAALDELERVAERWNGSADTRHLAGFLSSFAADSRFKLMLMLRAKRVHAGLETEEGVMEDLRNTGNTGISS